MDNNTQIVLINVNNNNGRQLCEQLENFVYPTLGALEDKLREENLKFGYLILTISQFMDEVNDQLLDDLRNYFITYVKIG